MVVKNIPVEVKIERLQKELKEHIYKTQAHWQKGCKLPNGPKRDAWHNKWLKMKQKEKELDKQLESSIDFAAKKAKKKKPARKKTKSFSEHLLSKM